MLQRRLFRPSMIVAILALFVALGGVGYTATQLPKGSVGRAQLRSGAVTESKLARNAVTGAKVKDRSLSGADIDLKRLGKVPAATSADRAATATSATSADRALAAGAVDGQHVDGVAATIPLRGTAKVAGADGGLELLASCSASGALTLVAKSTTAHAIFRASTVTGSSPPASAAVIDDADLNPDEELTLFSGSGGSGTAQVVYLGADGRVTTAVLGFGALTGTQTCTVVGTVVRK